MKNEREEMQYNSPFNSILVTRPCLGGRATTRRVRNRRRVIGIRANFPLGENGFVLNGNRFPSQFAKLIRFECNWVHLICE